MHLSIDSGHSQIDVQWTLTILGDGQKLVEKDFEATWTPGLSGIGLEPNTTEEDLSPFPTALRQVPSHMGHGSGQFVKFTTLERIK